MPQTRSKQYELFTNGFKEAEAGIAKFETLPKSTEEIAAWKEFQDSWNAWKKSLEILESYCREKDQLLAGGMKLDDSRTVSIDDKTFETATETRAMMLGTLDKLQQLTTLSNQLADQRIKEGATDAASSILVMFSAIGFGCRHFVLAGHLHYDERLQDAQHPGR